MGHTSQNCRNIRPCRVSLVCCFLLLGGGVVVLVLGGCCFGFFEETICTFLNCLNTQQPDSLTCNLLWGARGKSGSHCRWENQITALLPQLRFDIG